MKRSSFKGIRVVGMSRERAWEIAMNAVAAAERSARRPATALARRVAELIAEGMVRREVMERLGITDNQYDSARQAAKRMGLVEGVRRRASSD